MLHPVPVTTVTTQRALPEVHTAVAVDGTVMVGVSVMGVVFMAAVGPQ